MGSEKKGKKGGRGTEIRSGSDWHFIVNKIFIREFCSKQGLYEWNFIVTCQAVPANSNWRLGSWFEILEISCIDGVVWKFCIPVVKTFGTGFNICEVGIIDILDAGGIRPSFVDVCWYWLFRGAVERLGLFVVGSTRIVTNNLNNGAEQLRDRYFFYVWRGRWIFCEFLPGVGLWGFYWGRYSETGVWRLDNWDMRKILTESCVVENSWIQFWSVLRGKFCWLN